MTANLWHGIIDDPNLSSSEKLVALVYVRHQAGSGWSWVGPERISRLSGLSRSKVYEAIKGLRAKNWRRTRQRGGREEYRIEQIQGLLFSADDRLFDRDEPVENPVEIPGKPVEGSGNPSTRWIHRPPPGRDFPENVTQTPSFDQLPGNGRNRRPVIQEFRKPRRARANPARGNFNRAEAETARLIRDIAHWREIYTGASGSDLLRRDARLEPLLRRLEQLRGRAEIA